MRGQNVGMLPRQPHIVVKKNRGAVARRQTTAPAFAQWDHLQSIGSARKRRRQWWRPNVLTKYAAVAGHPKASNVDDATMEISFCQRRAK